MSGFLASLSVCVAVLVGGDPTLAPARSPRVQAKHEPATPWLVEAQTDSRLHRRTGLGHRDGHKGHHLAMAQESARTRTEQKWDRSVPWVPTFIPWVGMANISTPTLLPPPPPTLNPATDIQPFDTAIGDYILDQFGAGPTAHPPPTQDVLDAAYGCPLFLLPGTFKVLADPGCKQPRGATWTTTGGDVVMNYAETCNPQSFGDTYYTLPIGDLMGYSKTVTPWQDGMADKFDLFDCGDNHLYTVTEQISTRSAAAGGADVFVKWDITTATGAPVGTTLQVPLFSDDWKIVDTIGLPIFTIHRDGAWKATDACPDYQKTWVVTAGGSGSPLLLKPNRWIAGVFVTAWAMREQTRQADGFARWSTCYTKAWSYEVGFNLIGFAIIITLVLLFYVYGMDRVKALLFKFEDKVLPKTACKPSHFDP